MLVEDEGVEVGSICAYVDGALVVRADSTAWAVQVRLLLPQLERRLAEEVLRGGAGLEVADGPALAAALRALLEDETRRKALAAAGRELLSIHRGAADRQARSLAELLG